jgi:hypothetical protein
VTSAVAAEKHRIAWGYEPNTPVCRNCVGYRKATIVPGAPREKVLVKATCSKGGFAIEAGGCCDKWSSRGGERLLKS